MPTPLQYITVRASSYLTEPYLTDMISQATLEVGNTYCGSADLQNKAIALLVCHWIALSKRDPGMIGISGSLVSEKEGDLSRTFGNTMDYLKNTSLAQTSWGVELIELRNSTMVLPRNRFIDNG